MPLVHIVKEDWYPMFNIYRTGDYGDFLPFEVPQELLDRWHTVILHFRVLQHELAQIKEPTIPQDEILPADDGFPP